MQPFNVPKIMMVFGFVFLVEVAALVIYCAWQVYA